jgi:hypothetical protein
LRHIADADQHPTQRVYPTSDAFFSVAWPLFEAGKKTGELKPIHDHPYHAASAIIGTTIFYASALAPLVPSGDFDPLSPEQVAAHKQDALHRVRHFLGMRVPKPAPSKLKKATRSASARKRAR